METKICKVCQTEKAIDSFEKITDKRRGDTYFFIRDTCRKCIYQKRKGKRKYIPKTVVENNQRYTFDINRPYTKISLASLRPLPKPFYCDYKMCRCLLPQNEHLIKQHNKITYHFCDEWCWENEITKQKKIHECLRCSKSTSPIRRKSNGCITKWRTLCDNCVLNYRNEKRISKKSISI